MSGNLRFLGNVPVGAEGGVGIDVLSRYYDAIVFAYGAAKTKSWALKARSYKASIQREISWDGIMDFHPIRT